MKITDKWQQLVHGKYNAILLGKKYIAIILNIFLFGFLLQLQFSCHRLGSLAIERTLGHELRNVLIWMLAETWTKAAWRRRAGMAEDKPVGAKPMQTNDA
jgi:hypothetical protein